MPFQFPWLEGIKPNLVLLLYIGYSEIEKQVEVCHRIREWLGLDETLNIIYFQTSCNGQQQLPLDEVSQSPIQTGFEHF